MYSILLVEDSTLIQQTITQLLSECEALRVGDIVRTSQEAVQLLNAQSYDMVIADIELEKGTGFDVVKFINSKEFPFPKPEVVMLTNHGNSYYRSLAKNLNVKYFFDKSMQFDECIELVGMHATKGAK